MPMSSGEFAGSISPVRSREYGLRFGLSHNSPHPHRRERTLNVLPDGSFADIRRTILLAVVVQSTVVTLDTPLPCTSRLVFCDPHPHRQHVRDVSYSFAGTHSHSRPSRWALYVRISPSSHTASCGSCRSRTDLCRCRSATLSYHRGR
ncbi:MAG: hypothetical protein J07HQW2_03573 [Haloquadratum walsbyi J07HQW2]|uniref:Uncharacterized protein n=1 Tax=Haloquadratum walsbyi J07HQW2 TaxID=1238425 RepID=U1PTF8_9EURY|nr:MAG: hypothetical protein J07HQW2_03573 [Haloquadratum walsbyi J07HQW2]